MKLFLKTEEQTTDLNSRYVVKKFSTSEAGDVIVDEGGEIRVRDKDEDSERLHICILLGAKGVGKTSICSQLVSSEHAASFSIAHEEGKDIENRLLGVEMKGKTERFLLVEASTDEHIEDMINRIRISFPCVSWSPVLVYVVVFCVDRRDTFEKADELLTDLKSSHSQPYPHITLLLGNKVDLARKRQVSEEMGTTLAQTHGSQYIEVSSGLEYNLDTVLVKMMEKLEELNTDNESRRKKTSVREKMKGLMSGKPSPNSRSPSPRVVRLER